MARPGPDKTDLLDRLAAHVLESGLNTASLRPMAAAAGTSDRMLIYHFGSKDRLIVELLAHLSSAMAAGLDDALPPTVLPSEAALVARIVALLRSDAFRPYLRVWLDIVSAAAQGSEPHGEAGRAIVSAYLDWIAARHPEGAAGAPRALALIEGLLVLDAVGRGDLADAAIGPPAAR